MAPRVRSPFAGFPAAWLVYDSRGNPTFHVEPRILTPFRAVVLGYTSDIAVFAGIGYGLWSVAAAENPNGWMLAAAFIVPIALHAPL